MSEFAGIYYHERAEKFGDIPVPPILEGDPFPLTRQGEAVSVHHPNPTTTAAIESRLRENLASTHDFVLACTPDNPEYPKRKIDGVAMHSEKAVKGFIGKVLTPKSVNTGRVDEITLEAIARKEVAEPALQRLRARSFTGIEQNDDGENTELYFDLKGQLKTGGRKITVGGLIVVRSVLQTQNVFNKHPRKSTIVQYMADPLRANEQQGRNIQRESAAIGNAVAEHWIRRPYRG